MRRVPTGEIFRKVAFVANSLNALNPMQLFCLVLKTKNMFFCNKLPIILNINARSCTGFREVLMTRSFQSSLSSHTDEDLGVEIFTDTVMNISIRTCT